MDEVIIGLYIERTEDQYYEIIVHNRTQIIQSPFGVSLLVISHICANDSTNDAMDYF